MKGIIRNHKRIGIFIMIFLFSFSSICLAVNKVDIKKLPMQNNVPCDKIWIISFNEQVKLETIIKDNIFIKDSKGNDINIKFEISKDKKSVQIVPISKYMVGEIYTIHVSNLITNEMGNKISSDTIEMDFTVADQLTDLPVVGTEAKLRELLNGKVNRYYEFKDSENISMEGTQLENTSQEVNYSNTNIQVKGVDEGDTVKTDGKNIYRINKQNVEIIKAYPAEDMKILNTIDFKDKSFFPKEIYVDGNNMIIVGNYCSRVRIDKLKEPQAKTNKDNVIIEDNEKENVKIFSPYLGKNIARVLVYDISNVEDIKEVRKVELDGYVLSTRKIGNRLYLMSNEYMGYYTDLASNITPRYFDSAVGANYIPIDYDKIHYVEGAPQPNCMMMAGINLDNLKEPANIYTCLGGGENIYVSKDNLYITVTDNEYINYKYKKTDDLYNEIPSILARKDETKIYKFKLENGEFQFKAMGQVKGSILNQFSMDEYKNYFRIATTTNEEWNSNVENPTENNLYILDEQLNVKGKLENMAIDEKIYSVRFVEDKGYIVTFKSTDPLFVVDLKDAENPTILGELKIPGFSSYLQPYDENHIIGIGKDTEEIVTKDKDGKIINTRVIEKGIKLSLFDVTDYKNPKEKFNTIIGDAGSYSEALTNHKALLLSKEKNILAFPISVINIEEKDKDKGSAYGKQVFQGAYIYNMDLVNGFQFKGDITHLSTLELNKDSYGTNYDKNIQRILYINDTLYTISDDMIMANDIETLLEKSKITE